jgi:hypothetical protein
VRLIAAPAFSSIAASAVSSSVSKAKLLALADEVIE